MGLSTPLALLVGALVALPVIAHLVRRADVERRVLPTVALLRRVVVRDRRRARITEPYLLALRVAAVIAATLALAGPFLVERLAYGDGSALSVVLVIDDSASMAQRVDGTDETAFDRARERARDVVRSVGDGSEIAIVLAGRPARLLLPRSSDRGAVLGALDPIRVGARRTDLEGALSLASRQLASAHLAARRVIILSDFALEAPPPLRASADVELVSVASAEMPSNVGISEVRALPDPLEAGAWSATVELSAHGPAAPSSVVLAVRPLATGAGQLGDDRPPEITRTSVSIVEGHGRATLRFRAPTGTERVALELLDTHDASRLDDVRVLALRPPRASRIVLVEPAGARTARFATRALAAVPEEAGGFLASAIDADHLAAHRAGRIDPDEEAHPDPLADADVLVLAGVVPSSPSALETLRSFVEGGGGLLVAPSPGARSIDLAAIEELLPAHVGEVREVALAGEGPALVPGEGPAIVPPGPTGLEGLSVRSALTLEADAEQTSLRLADGAPFLVLDEEHRRAVLAVGLDDAMSDLPLRVGFVPLLASLAQRLARPGALPDHPFVAGEAPPLRVASDVSALEIVTPTGEVMSRELEHGAVTLDDLAEPGAYAVRVEQGGRVRELDRAALVIVPPADEIDLTPHVPDMRERPSAETQRGESRLPVERWIYVLVGLLAAIEGFARLGLVRVPTRTG